MQEGGAGRPLAGLVGQRPQHQRQGGALGLETVQGACAAGRVGGAKGVAQGVDVIAGDVEHGRLGVLERDLALRVEQAQLLDFLVGGEEIALDVGGDEVEGLARRRLVLALQTCGDPGRQLRDARCGALDGDASLGELDEPGGLLRLPVELGQRDQGDGARGQAGAVAAQRLAAVAARLARGDAQVDQLVAAEQREVAGGHEQVVPLEALGHHQHLALCVAMVPGRGADRVGGLDGEQAVAVHHVERGQALLQLPGKLLGPQVHCTSGAACALAVASRRSSCCTRSFWMSRQSSTSSASFESTAASSKVISREMTIELCGT